VEDDNLKKQWDFVCNRWFAKDEGDGTIEADFELGTKNAGPELANYRITVTTPNIRGAGTSANVFVQLFGEKLKSPQTFLDSGKNNFQRGASDIFGLDCNDVGELQRITVGHDNSGFGPGWFIGKVFVKNLTRDVQWRFNANRWLAKDEADGKTSLDLKPSADAGLDIVTYEIHVTTGSKRGAGTDADVRIALFGTQGQTNDFILDNDKDNFERGKLDSFLIDHLDIGELQTIRIGHNDKGIGAGWFLLKVEVKNQATGKVWGFPCNLWLDKAEGDGAVVRTLKVGNVDGLKEK